MRDYASQPAPEVELLRKQVEKLKDNVRQEQAISQHKEQQAERKHREQVSQDISIAVFPRTNDS